MCLNTILILPYYVFDEDIGHIAVINKLHDGIGAQRLGQCT